MGVSRRLYHAGHIPQTSAAGTAWGTAVAPAATRVVAALRIGRAGRRIRANRRNIPCRGAFRCAPIGMLVASAVSSHGKGCAMSTVTAQVLAPLMVYLHAVRDEGVRAAVPRMLTAWC